jgi:hypothetical protein
MSRHLQLLLALASAVILRSESRGNHDHILLSQIWDSPILEAQVPIFMSPRNRVARLYPQALGSLSVASCDSQDYGGGIRPRLHTGCSFLVNVFINVKCLGVVPDKKLGRMRRPVFTSQGFMKLLVFAKSLTSPSRSFNELQFWRYVTISCITGTGKVIWLSYICTLYANICIKICHTMPQVESDLSFV